MMTAQTERQGALPAHLGYSSRRPAGADRSRPSNRSLQSGRSVFLEMDSLTNLSGLRGSMFEAAAPQRF